MLPTFLGIGAPKAGSTWLYELLRSHPDIAMAELRKEIHFFDRNYDRGQEWYEQFFAHAAGAKAVGEFTPHYLYCEELTERVAASAPSVDRLVLSLRDPVERTYSHYGFRARVEGYSESFEQFLEERPEGIRWSRYGENLRRLRPWLERGALLTLIFEEAVRDVEQTRESLAAFLDVAAEDFPPDAGHERVNKRYAPRFGRLYVGAISLARKLRAGDHYRVINFVKALGVKKLFEHEGSRPVAPMARETRLQLIEHFEPDVEVLEDLLGREITPWRKAWARHRAEEAG